MRGGQKKIATDFLTRTRPVGGPNQNMEMARVRRRLRSIGATLTIIGLGAPVALATPGGAPGEPVSGTVTDLAGQPMRGLVVFAADARDDVITTVGSTDEAGRVVFDLPRRRHNFGILSPRLAVVRIVPAGVGGFGLVVQPLPRPTLEAPETLTAATIEPQRLSVIRGRVVDPSGHGLGGVHLAVRRASPVAPDAEPVSAGLSALDGRFALVVPGGRFAVTAHAPGLALDKSAFGRGRLVIVLRIPTTVQYLSFSNGHVLRFRPQDSIDPEYTPPAAVRAYLLYSYGICPRSGPMTAREKRGLTKYWYIDVLRRPAPNPASVSTTSCVTPGAFENESRLLLEAFGPLPQW